MEQTRKDKKDDNDFTRVTSAFYFGRPSPFLSDLMFFLNPAPDNLMASNIMALTEMIFAMSILRLGYRLPMRGSGNRAISLFKKVGAYLISAHLFFSGGLQCTMNQLVGDDTILAADAKRQRHELLALDEPVNWWFGPKRYQYMGSEELKFLTNRAKLLELNELQARGALIIRECKGWLTEADQYFHKKLLPSLRGKKFEPDSELPVLQLQDLDLEKHFNQIWFQMLDPWEELWREVNLTINFIPKWNFFETPKNISKAEKEVDEVIENEDSNAK